MSLEVSTSPSIRDVLAALALPSIGPATIRKALAQSIESALFRQDVQANWLWPIFERASSVEVSSAYSSAEKVLKTCYDHGIVPCHAAQPEYPPSLLSIQDFPPVIYVRGQISALSLPSVAIVGTRRPTKVGTHYARKIAVESTRLGLAVVSGLALGIDAEAHKAALEEGGTTIAVLAHGLDTVSPSRHRPLAEEIVEKGGALLSEHAPGVPPRPAEFVRRNRLQSGLALASIMIESGAEGGSIHQARFTRDQGRRLYAFVPPEGVTSSRSFNDAGARRIIEEFGASKLSSRQDLQGLHAELRARQTVT